MFHEATRILESPLYSSLVAMRRDLHQHPELSWQETRTAEKVCAYLDELGVSYRRGVAGTGIVAEFPGGNGGPFIALRADLDALPILEETGLPFASQVPGAMHACGHDAHTTMLLGAASLLAQDRELPAPVRLIFQPAEEFGEGAPAMIEAGVLDNVALIFGGHVDRHFPVGSIAVTDGPVNASSDSFTIRITGRGGHAARPHETVDAVIVGSLIVMALQTIVSREVNPSHPSVVTVGHFDAGTAANVIAGQALLEGSIRAQENSVRLALHRSIERIAKAICQMHGADLEFSIGQGTPPLCNPPEGARVARLAAAAAVGEGNVARMDMASMGGEDFSYYLEHVPGCYVRFGTARDGVEQFPAHSSRFVIDEEALAVGAAFFHAVAKVAGQSIHQVAP
ncbi:MAG: amidohydrolase [Planctomycetota bacterium]|nr:MAG: amidohydrolase [Planctomycetota bacterium]